MILGQVWGGEYGSEAEYLRVYVYRLRRKLGDAEGRLLRTSPGIGHSSPRTDPGRPRGRPSVVSAQRALS